MVPHETLETKILESLGLEPGEQGIVTVVGVADKSKREQLTSTSNNMRLDSEDREASEEIPILGSGKVDLGKCRQVAIEP